MTELNTPACPTHGSLPRALHTENFEGIVTVVSDLIETVSGVGTTSYSRCPYGYPSNFEGVVRVLEDLNTSISGIGAQQLLLGGSGTSVRYSGDFQIIDAGVLASSNTTVGYSGHFVSIASTATAGIALATVSGAPGNSYVAGALWFDADQGRLFVYASGNGVSDPAWYQTNAEAIVSKSEVPPSGTGLNAPPRDGSLWFNNLMGNLFVYDISSSGWYEVSSDRSVSYSAVAPAATSAQGAGWFDTNSQHLLIWDGTNWVQV